VFNLYAIATAGGEPQRLTTSAESQFPEAYFPADDRVLYAQDSGGNELTHLFVLDGKATDLTPGEKVKAMFGGFSADGTWFWVSTNERDPKAFDVYRYSAKDYKRTLVFTNKRAGTSATSATTAGGSRSRRRGPTRTRMSSSAI
jgi:hypothetical protein